jgi:hypothetical protein
MTPAASHCQCRSCICSLLLQGRCCRAAAAGPLLQGRCCRAAAAGPLLQGRCWSVGGAPPLTLPQLRSALPRPRPPPRPAPLPRPRQNGCGRCRRAPRVARPKARCVPDRGIPQTHIPEAPTFYPTAEEFADPFAFLQSIAPKAAAGGIALIVPPPGWAPTSRLLDPVTGRLRTDFKFPVRRQPTHLLCRRFPTADGGPPGEADEAAAGAAEASEGGGKAPGDQQEAEGARPAAGEDVAPATAAAAVAVAVAVKAKPKEAAPGRMGSAGGGRMGSAAGGRMGAAAPGGRMGAAAPGGRMGAATPSSSCGGGGGGGDDGSDSEDEEGGEGDDHFGYDIVNEPFDLPTFKRYAEWAKRRHFSSDARGGGTRGGRRWGGGSGGGVVGGGGEGYQEPSIEEIEAEFWRLVEVANEQSEALYGQDVDSAAYGSGFHTRVDEAAAALAAAFPPRRAALAAEAGAARAALGLALPAGGGGGVAGEKQEGGAEVGGPARPAEEECAGCKKEQQQEEEARRREAEVINIGAEAGRCAAAAQSCALASAGAGPAAGAACGSCHHCRLRAYAHHPWNVNNVPIGRDSVLRFVKEQVRGKKRRPWAGGAVGGAARPPRG